MTKIVLVIDLLIIALVFRSNCITLDRNQLELWYPNYLKLTSLNLFSRGIISIETDTFVGLSQIQELFLQTNQLISLNESKFNDLKI